VRNLFDCLCTLETIVYSVVVLAVTELCVNIKWEFCANFFLILSAKLFTCDWRNLCVLHRAVLIKGVQRGARNIFLGIIAKGETRSLVICGKYSLD
jgi:hypothetical protein